MATTIHTILDQMKKDVWSQREVGNRFERLIKAYLLKDPLYQDKFSDVWLWGEWPETTKHQDTGIDLVAKERDTGEYCAIQCKFYDPSYSLQKSDIDSFFTASGKKPFTSRLIVSTTDNWSKNAEEALEDQQIPVTRLRVQDLANSPINWSEFSLSQPQEIKLKAKKTLRPHQIDALNDVMNGFEKADRGKLIMACGTGKTFTALKIAEKMVKSKGHVLFLVPSISLLSQSLREWTAEADLSLHCFAVCSDIKVGKARSENEDITLHDLAFPATTSHRKLALQLNAIVGKRQLTVVFGTYQSIKVVSDAQKHGAPEFDLVICDEAHRTTGVTLEGEDESHFVKVHDEDFIKARKRLYMTATPRIYSDESKTKAKENEAILCSMDDKTLYGEEIHRLDFSESVRRDLLSDYKVMVLAVDEKYVSNTFQHQLSDSNREMKLEDAVKITGCWNGLSKRYMNSADGGTAEVDTAPMRRAVAFSQSIKASQQFTKLFSDIINQYRQQHEGDENWLTCQVEHVDGTFNALVRNEKLDWLKQDTSAEGNICRILSNARCLAEGVDVPALDAVMFLNPRNSVVDVVQSVGRVMRKSEGKKYGYIILPIGVPADVPPEVALNDHKKYKIVWQVLQALRAHDNRFNATINQIDLNKNRTDQIQIIGVGGGEDGEGKGEGSDKPVQTAFNFPNIEEWRNAIYAKIVLKCGDRKYWESWAQDVAKIADSHIARIKGLLIKPKPQHRKAFDDFLGGLRENLNPSVEENDAIEMLAQHLITKPVFDALFEGYQFTKQNPVSIAMQNMLDVLEGQNIKKETESLDRFYESVKERASGIDNVEGKQRIIVELYEKFFKTAFPRMADRMGIVYTPVEVVDFIVKSVGEALQQEYGLGISSKNVHVLDPFTGTGTFIVRLLQSGLIKPEDLNRKYMEELHANEIILLAYYIAAINIEEAYHSQAGGEYRPFPGIVLTDTFQNYEAKGTQTETFPENSERVRLQNKQDIRVIIGNPPYSAGQSSENDANKNLKYPQLDEKIRKTYAAHSNAAYLKNLYDLYIRSIRWASDRIGKKGVVCYISNGSFIDGNAMDGLRKCLAEEFSTIYCFNLRGNARTSGEQRRKEKGNVFGEGTRTPVAITLLIKNPESKQPSKLFYHDIGDYLTQEQKLKIVSEFGSFKTVPWTKLTPNSSHDWINQRDPAFDRFIPLGDKDGKEPLTMFNTYSLGVLTARDAWAYNFNKGLVIKNMKRMIAFYNDQMEAYKAKYEKVPKERRPEIDEFIDKNSSKISWTYLLKKDLVTFINHKYEHLSEVVSSYRPYCKQYLYFNRKFNERVYLMPQVFPQGAANLTICTTGIGATRPFSALLVNTPANYHFHDTGQCFPLYYYGDQDKNDAISLPGFDSSKGQNNENISEKVLKVFQNQFNARISKEDLFYYVYGIFHSPEYKTRFESDLKKMLPRIPMVKDFWAFSKAGRELAKWHLNYETVEPYPLEQHLDQLDFKQKDLYRVKEMKFGKKDGKEDKTTIIYNSHITLSRIPLEAYEYVVNGRPAIEWIMERYRVMVDKDSGISNDPNDWSEDPQYILNLVKRIVRVSLETMKIVKSLPPLDVIDMGKSK